MNKWSPEQKSFLILESCGVLSRFTSSHLSILGVTLWYLVNLELTFVQDDRWSTNFLSLHVVIQFSQCPLLKMLCFPQGVFWHLYQIPCRCSFVYSYTVFYFVPLLFISVFFLPVPYCFYYSNSALQLEISYGDHFFVFLFAYYYFVIEGLL